SAEGEGALRAQAARLRTHVSERPELEPADVGFSLATTRSRHRHRAVVLARDRAGFLDGLAALASGGTLPNVVQGTAETRGGTAFVFPGGQGAQWAGLGRELADSSAAFAERLAACAEALEPHVEWSLSEVLRGRPGAPPPERADVAQPVAWAGMVALAELWRSQGVRPTAVMGEGEGEISALHIAGALSLEESAQVVALRGRMAVGSAERRAKDAEERAPDAQIGVSARGADVPYFCTAEGDWLATEGIGARYWCRDDRSPGGLGEAARALVRKGCGFLIELGAHHDSTPDLEKSVDAADSGAVVLRSFGRGEDGLHRFLASLCEAHTRGLSPDWNAVFAGTGASRVDLPTYAFQRQRYWLGDIDA
ncbi:acyltransferase domain-containing protein, partial [Allosalinactinospora lopnorensis]|uniref:acyltransferase domain-containing protein n=1 Tax=Allosalinactinospora lopnorensis TaxID=1352348 RepID=UPI000623E9FA